VKNEHKNISKGFTLIEAVTSLALWMILALGLMSIWQYTSRVSTAVIARQDRFENARVAMDPLLVNIQLAEFIRLEIDRDYVLKQMTLRQRNPEGHLHNYIFYFNVNALPGEAKHHRLEFGLNNEFASHIKKVFVRRESESYFSVMLETADDYILHGSADVRYKEIIVIQSP
jgi:type II secretory pathway component PulJ